MRLRFEEVLEYSPPRRPRGGAPWDQMQSNADLDAETRFIRLNGPDPVGAQFAERQTRSNQVDRLIAASPARRRRERPFSDSKAKRLEP